MCQTRIKRKGKEEKGRTSFEASELEVKSVTQSVKHLSTRLLYSLTESLSCRRVTRKKKKKKIQSPKGQRQHRGRGRGRGRGRDRGRGKGEGHQTCFSSIIRRTTWRSTSFSIDRSIFLPDIHKGISPSLSLSFPLCHTHKLNILLFFLGCCLHF